MNSRKGTRGDQIVQVSLKMPDMRDERTKDLLRKLGEVESRRSAQGTLGGPGKCVRNRKPPT